MIVYSYWLLKGVDTELLYMIELSHIETGDDWDMWDSDVVTEQTQSVNIQLQFLKSLRKILRLHLQKSQIFYGSQ